MKNPKNNFQKLKTIFKIIIKQLLLSIPTKKALSNELCKNKLQQTVPSKDLKMRYRLHTYGIFNIYKMVILRTNSSDSHTTIHAWFSTSKAPCKSTYEKRDNQQI